MSDTESYVNINEITEEEETVRELMNIDYSHPTDYYYRWYFSFDLQYI